MAQTGQTLRRRVILAVLLGLITTLLVGWTAMSWPIGGGDGPGPSARTYLGLVKTADGQTLWQVEEGHNAWHRVVRFSELQISGRSIMIPEADFQKGKFDISSLPKHLRPEAVDDLYMLAWYRQAGWPLPALGCSIHWVNQISNADIVYEVRGGWQLPRDADFHPRALPLTPLWPGLLVDVALWSIVWFGIIRGCGTLRQWRRVRSGRCRHCGYLLTGLSAGSRCPECGGGSASIAREPKAIDL